MQVHLSIEPVEETWSDECLTWFREKIIQISGTAIFRNREIDIKESSSSIGIGNIYSISSIINQFLYRILSFI